MSRRTTLQHALVAALATGVVIVAPAVGKPVDRVDRFGSPEPAPTPHQDLRGEHATDPAPPGSEQFLPGQPTWPTHPAPAAKPAIKLAPAAPVSDGNNDDVWLIVGISVAAAGIVAGSAAGAARRNRVRARRVTV
jgi:hypothetical protein